MQSRLIACLVLATLWPAAAQAQGQIEDRAPVPSQCIAVAQDLPHVTFASFEVAQATTASDVTIRYAGHSTYVIETPGGVRIATDYSGHYGRDPLPDVVTMNKAHSTHFTLSPDPGIAHVLRGWDDVDPPARHALVVDDVYIRNVATDIRSWGGGAESGGNSIFIFEVAGLCIGHLGHLHHALDDSHYAAIGRLDIVMVPIDGGMTLSIDAMSEITGRLQSSLVLPMHRFATPISSFAAGIGENFAVEYRDSPSFTVSARSLPRQPTVLILQGV
jgi:L-ascorbate metabolism protein UlaG (beta-lactamase superfamily)